jgi:hypothetical protein
LAIALCSALVSASSELISLAYMRASFGVGRSSEVYAGQTQAVRDHASLGSVRYRIKIKKGWEGSIHK